MRILHCLRAPVGGLFRHVLDLAAEQARRGHDVGILADSRTGDRLTNAKFDAVAPLMRLGVDRIPIPRQPGLGDFAAARAVAVRAKRLSIDVLHGHGAKGGAYARLAGAALTFSVARPKVFYTPHGGALHLDAGAIAARALLAVEHQMERFSDGLIFESRFAANAYAERVGPPRAPARVIHNGLGQADFERTAPDAAATDLLFVGELRALKGVDILIDAIAEVNRDRPVTATLVGAGADAEKLKLQVARLNLQDRVRFAGALPARQAFRLGHLIVVPSLKESFPYIVLEAAAAGLPIIATDVGGIPEIVSGTDTPLIRAGSRAALADALRAHFANPALSLARADRLKTNVTAKFSVDSMAAGVLDFYALTFAQPRTSAAIVNSLR